MGKRTYTSAKRAAGRQQTRKRIIAAAETVLAEAGWSGFSLEAVAVAAGVTRLTVYNHFGQRRTLLEAVFDANAERAGFEAIGRAMGGDDPRIALAAIVSIFCGFWQSGRGPMKGIVAEAMTDPEFFEVLAARNQRRKRLLDVLVGRMAESGAVKPSKAAGLTETLFALTSHAFYAELGALTPEARRETVTALAMAAVEKAGRA